jgi:hypothetical protein
VCNDIHHRGKFTPRKYLKAYAITINAVDSLTILNRENVVAIDESITMATMATIIFTYSERRTKTIKLRVIIVIFFILKSAEIFGRIKLSTIIIIPIMANAELTITGNNAGPMLYKVPSL